MLRVGKTRRIDQAKQGLKESPGMAKFPARIHVLLARDVPVGVVIRRGPAKSVAVLLWDRRNDHFRLGQWLRGRIYERRCDLSPDGEHLIYFAMKGKWSGEAKGSWTAISRAPFLKALAMFPKGDCWNGGGLWTGNGLYWLNDGYGHAVMHDVQYLRRDFNWHPSVNYGGECPGIYYHRLMRDGWTLAGQERAGSRNDGFVFEKPCPRGWTLKKISHAQIHAGPGKGCYWDEHVLVHPSRGSITCPDWEWADLDGDRLVWATGGRLETGRLTPQGLTDRRMLHDFNDMVFEAIAAPY